MAEKVPHLKKTASQLSLAVRPDGAQYMQEITFFDSLDFVSRNHDTSIAYEEIEFGTAQIVLALLRGWTPLISQTQAFDSHVILNAAAEGSDDAPSFRWLIEEAHIRVPLFNQATVCDAFAAALRNPHFRFLCWPEIVGERPSVDRNAIISMLKTRRRPSDLPDEVAARIGTVLALSSSVANCKRRFTAWAPSLTLSGILEKAHSEALRKGDAVAPILQSMLELESNSWGAHFAHLEHAPHDLRNSAVEILDMAYTAVVCESLRADRCIFRGFQNNAIEIMGNVISQNGRQNGITASVNKIGSLPAVVGWQELRKLREETSDLPVTERETLALAAGLLARLSIDRGTLLGFAPRVLTGLYSGLLWAGVPAVVAHLAHYQPGFLVTGFIPAFFGEVISVRKQIEDWVGHKIQSHYLSLLQERSESSKKTPPSG